LQLNLPHTSMRDLLVKDDDLIVATHGRSFWVLDDVAPLRELAAGAVEAAHLFKPAAAWRVHRSTNTDTPLPADEPAGENPPDGAIVDYSLGQDASGPVTLEVLDARGKVLRKYSSESVEHPDVHAWQTPLIPEYWLLKRGPLPKSAGMHRWVWDLRATAPTATHYNYPISAVPHRTPPGPEGPLVVPGTYTVRLTVDGKSQTAPLLVKMDPRVHATAAEIEQLHAAQTKLADRMDELGKADLEAHSVMEQVSAAKGAELAGFSAAVKKALDGAGEGKEPAGLDEASDEAGELYGQVQGADAAPTAAWLKAAAHAEEEGEEALHGWEAFKRTEIPKINDALAKAGAPAIDLKREPKEMPDHGDEE
jgi:hypothetical protein